MNLTKAVLLLSLVTQIVSLSASKCPEGQIKHKYCCLPVWNCKEGYYVKTCEREGAEDKCKKCPRGTQNPFNSSSFDIKKCYKSICKLDDSVAVADNHCECDRSKGWFGKNHLACQLNYDGCPAGKELTQRGICERCINFHYKDWHGNGFCKKHFNCSLLQMNEIKGNSSQGNKCIKKGLKSATTTPSTTVTTASTSATYSITKETTAKVETTRKTITTTGEIISDLIGLTLSPTKVSQNLPVVGNRGPLDNVVRDRKLEGILIVVVTLLSVLLLVLVIGTMAYMKKRKSSPDVPIPNRPALPLPNMQNEVFDPPVCQTQRQTQPLLQPENPYLCMSNPNQSCIYALPASLHLNNNYAMNRSPLFDTVSTYGLNYAPPENRPMPTASPNSLGSQATLQSRNEHLYMTLPAVRSENDVMYSSLARAATAATTPHQESMNLENRNSTATENFYEFP